MIPLIGGAPWKLAEGNSPAGLPRAIASRFSRKASSGPLVWTRTRSLLRLSLPIVQRLNGLEVAKSPQMARWRGVEASPPRGPGRSNCVLKPLQRAKWPTVSVAAVRRPRYSTAPAVGTLDSATWRPALGTRFRRDREKRSQPLIDEKQIRELRGNGGSRDSVRIRSVLHDRTRSGVRSWPGLSRSLSRMREPLNNRDA